MDRSWLETGTSSSAITATPGTPRSQGINPLPITSSKAFYRIADETEAGLKSSL
jgi:hypothetical protein